MHLNRTLAALMIAAAALVSTQCGKSDGASPSSSGSLSLPTTPSSLDVSTSTDADTLGGDLKSLTRAVGDLTNSTPEFGRLKVCKEGNSGTFLVTVKTNSNGNPSPNPSGSTSVAINTCKVVAEDFTNVTGQGTTFTMGESSAGCLSAVRNDLGSGTTPITCANTDYFLNNFHGITVTFTNSPPPAQLAVVKTPDGGTFSQGAQVSFTIVVSNPAPAGSASATNVTLNDTLPGNGGLVWSTASATQGSCTSPIVGNALSCSLGTIAPGGSVTVTVTSTATTPNAACQSQPNPAANAAASGGLTATDSGSLSCTPPPPQLAVVKTPDGGTFTQGAQVSFTIVVSNPAAAGSSSATNVTLNDTLPGNGGLLWQTASASQGSCTSPIVGNALSCQLGTIAPGGSVTVTVTSTATTPNAACQSQPNPAANAAASGGLNATDSGSLSCTPPPSISHGCTPGFWKTHASNPPWGSYTPSQTVGSVFTIPAGIPGAAGFAAESLETALGGGGGSGLAGKTTILLRAAVAALLNADNGNPVYPISVAQVISQTNAALASLNQTTITNLATQLDTWNNRCDTGSF